MHECKVQSNREVRIGYTGEPETAGRAARRARATSGNGGMTAEEADIPPSPRAIAVWPVSVSLGCVAWRGAARVPFFPPPRSKLVCTLTLSHSRYATRYRYRAPHKHNDG